jgi:hypothetical protein
MSFPDHPKILLADNKPSTSNLHQRSKEYLIENEASFGEPPAKKREQTGDTEEIAN